MPAVSPADQLLKAAVARLARGDGQGSLRSLGIQATELLRDAGVGNGVLYNEDLRARGEGDVAMGVANELLDFLLEGHLELRSQFIENYRTHARSIADGAGKDTVAAALLEELDQYRAGEDADDLTKARERAYYLAVALCDSSVSKSARPLAGDADPLPDLRFRRHLLDLHLRDRQALLGVYEEFLEAADRRPVHDLERLERVLAAFLEGVVLQRRIVESHRAVAASAVGPDPEDLCLGDEELVDAVLRIFIVMSRPSGGEALDPEAVLFRRGRGSDSPSLTHPVLHLDGEALYERMIGAIEELDTGQELSHSSLAASGATPPRKEICEALNDAVTEFAARGGTLRNVEKIDSLAELEATIETLAEQVADGQEVRYRALVIDAPPNYSPVLFGKQAAVLGREEDGLLADGMFFTDRVGRRWCRNHFESIWDDDRAYTLATPRGLNDRGIEGARIQLERLEERRRSRSPLGN